MNDRCWSLVMEVVHTYIQDSSIAICMEIHVHSTLAHIGKKER